MTTIVTGGSSGIGRAVTELLLGRGDHVVVVDLDVEPLRELSLNTALTLVQGDVTDEAILQQATADGVDGLVACAGISRPGSSHDYPRSDWSAIMSINLEGVFNAMRQCRARARAGASFVAISSISGVQGFAGRAAYSASKAGVDGLVRSLAVEYAPDVRVNAIAPGYILTDLVRRNLAAGHISEEAILARTPMQKWGAPEDIAYAAKFLLSPEAAWITGTTMLVDGGWTSYGLGLGSHE